MKSKIIILALLTSVFLQYSFIQNTCSIQGTITDKHSGQPVLFATIALYQNGTLIGGTETNLDGNYIIKSLAPGIYDVEFSYIGYATKRITGVALQANEQKQLNVALEEGQLLTECIIVGYKEPLLKLDNTTMGKTISSEDIRSLPTKNINAIQATSAGIGLTQSTTQTKAQSDKNNNRDIQDNESYSTIFENQFKSSSDEPLSTFAIDVDRASYSNIRRMINHGNIPPSDAVRIEEMINYFDYDYEEPNASDPFVVHSTLTDCPWNKDHNLLHLAMQSRNIKTDLLPPSNLVFLIDVSGSMNHANKLPLVKASLNLLVEKLRDNDQVSIVTYAGQSGIVLSPTFAKNRSIIKNAINSLGAGGSTAGAQGILTAYALAEESFLEGGNNRVILATDGDFNVGLTSNTELEALISQKRDSGIFLSIAGFGTGNYKDDKMQILANKGNGNHSYIDNIHEAKKVFVEEFAGTLFTVAKDVKIQIEFNPTNAVAYRLVGYENRLLEKEDFNDDSKDAGELGSGHSVTAIYEIIPAGKGLSFPQSVDSLKYQTNLNIKSSKSSFGDELATLKYRYKLPDAHKSIRSQTSIKQQKISLNKSGDDIQFSIAVAHFGLILRNSAFVKHGSLDELIETAVKNKSDDPNGERTAFVELAKTAQLLGLRDIGLN